MPDIVNTSAAQNYSKNLFEMHPNYRPTQSLFIDFEGSRGHERILSLYWPQLAGDLRFELLWRGWGDADLTTACLTELLMEMSCDPSRLKWITVFSGGEEQPNERLRFEDLFGSDFFPQAEWVDLHRVMRNSWMLRRAVRAARWARSTIGEQRAVNNLENLEYQFGYVRPRGIRGHNYQHDDGTSGGMHVLDREQELYSNSANLFDDQELIDYCRWDVETMFRITRWCEKNLR